VYYFVYIDMSAESQSSRTREDILAMHGLCKHIPPQPNHMTAVTDTHATIEELLEAVFSTVRQLELSVG
jgi:hypothetical protein